MQTASWYLLAGGAMVILALSASFIGRSPVSPGMLYLLTGAIAGPAGLGLIQLDVARDARLLESLAEIAVLVSVFVAGLKLAPTFGDGRWHNAARLAFVALPVSVGLFAVAAFASGWPFALALLLGAILAPTDPVLAGEVQVEGESDRDKVRFSLTGEAGLNDGTAFPFVMLSLLLLATPSPEPARLANWVLLDLLWPVIGGIGIGASCGTIVGRLVIWLRTRHAEALGLDEFLALGLIALSYGVALFAATYGFLAVFAAGLALRRIAAPAPAIRARVSDPATAATRPATAPRELTRALLHLNTSLERLTAFGVVFLTGTLLATIQVTWATASLIALLLFVVRPASVAICLPGTNTTPTQRTLIAWFGIRGVGSLYYLCFAASHGLAPDQVDSISTVVIAAIAASVVLHGISVTPAMTWYDRSRLALKARAWRRAGK